MALAHDLSGVQTQQAARRRCVQVQDALVKAGLYALPAQSSPDSDSPTSPATYWRISPSPFFISHEELSFFRELGSHLLRFYRTLNRLYHDSIHGAQPAWVADYLDQGKPESLITYSRMKRFRDLLPGVIRPDLIPAEHGMVMTELDSVPGGLGVTAALSHAYHGLNAGSPDHDQIVGGADGMVSGFVAMLKTYFGNDGGCIAIVVSDEAKEYRPEMTWLATRLRALGLETYCVDPREVRFTEERLFIFREAEDRPVSVVYRFFELFDLKNVPKSELIMYSAKKGRVAITPPFKPTLEEKLAFALFHHPVLSPFWRKELGSDTFDLLHNLMPRTWVLDPRPLPPTAVIPNLQIGERAVARWQDVAEASQRDRRYVVKPSGFSELAWGSRGVSVGHDLSQPKWAESLDTALKAFPTTPYIFQEFHKGRQFNLSYYEPNTDAVLPMAGRARLSPYYFVTGEDVELGGILATVCSLNKKVIHGMRDAIMAPCALGSAIGTGQAASKDSKN